MPEGESPGRLLETTRLRCEVRADHGFTAERIRSHFTSSGLQGSHTTVTFGCSFNVRPRSKAYMLRFIDHFH